MIKFPCWRHCDKPRLHFSCWRCVDRRVLKGKLVNMHYSGALQTWIPDRYRQLCEVWYDQLSQPWELQVAYVLFVDEQRRFRAEKDVLLGWVWRRALANNRAERAWLLRRLVSICENLAS